jgi:hypothetical protein
MEDTEARIPDQPVGGDSYRRPSVEEGFLSYGLIRSSGPGHEEYRSR